MKKQKGQAASLINLGQKAYTILVPGTGYMSVNGGYPGLGDALPRASATYSTVDLAMTARDEMIAFFEGRLQRSNEAIERDRQQGIEIAKFRFETNARDIEAVAIAKSAVIVELSPKIYTE